MNLEPSRFPTRRVIGLAALLLTACASPPVHERPAMTLPTQFSHNGVQWLASKGEAAPVSADWWKAFGDAELDRLQARVALDNQTIKQAEAAWRAARAALDSASAARLPGVSASASSSRARSAGAVSGSHALGVSATWEIDLWDRIRLGISAAEAGAQASAADLAAARLSIQASLAQTWLAWRAAATQIRLLQDTLTAQERFLALTRNRLQSGVASPLDVAQAETQVHSARAQISAAELEREQLTHALVSLLGGGAFPPPPTGEGRGEGGGPTGLLTTKPSLGPTPSPPALLPSTLLQRRPDIAAAERRVAAANANLGVAQTAWFPSLELGASAGVKSARLSNLLELPSRVWSLGPALALTLFDGGAREAARESARASHDQAVAAYRQTVLTAFQEVEDALAAARLLEQEATAQEDALAAARRARTIAEERYRAGMASALEVISARTSELAAARSVAALWSRRAGAAVTLLKNAGGALPE